MHKSDFKKMFELENAHFWFLGKQLCIEAFLNGSVRKCERILDIGCGTGGTTLFLKRFGEVQGLEYDDYALSLARKRSLTVTKGEAENLPFVKNSFEAVFLLDVLYHKNIISVEKALLEAKRILMPHGYIVITDSALPILRSAHDKVLGGKRRFTISQLEGLLKKTGFTVKKSSYFFFFLFPLFFIKRKIINALFHSHASDLTPVHPLINKIATLIMRCESWLLQFCSFPFGSSLIVLASKKGR